MTIMNTIYAEPQIPLPRYIKQKIKMLNRDFYIRLTDEDIRHFNELTTEIAVDNFAHQLILDRM